MKGKVSALTSVVLKKLKQEARNRKIPAKVVMVDEYLTSKIRQSAKQKVLSIKVRGEMLKGEKVQTFMLYSRVKRADGLEQGSNGCYEHPRCVLSQGGQQE